jgi:hypothetical protein
MKFRLIPLAGVAVLLGFMLTGCETVADRIQEKSTTYSSLNPLEQDRIKRGIIMVGYTPDMVYMAMGRASRVETENTDGGKMDLWIYSHYYPDVGAGHAYAPYNTESAYQPSRFEAGTSRPRGVGTPQSISTTGPPQGVMPEPPDLTAFTLKVLFKDGKVVKLGLVPN